jgi:hypothetical protein
MSAPSQRCRWLLVVGLFGCGSGGGVPSTDASVDGPSVDANGEAAPEADSASPPEGGAGADAACPPSFPGNSGACAVEGQSCTYDCYVCLCMGGGWLCEAPGCAGGCLGNAGPPPTEGEVCGGCCGPSYGDTCTFACPGDGGSITATCEARTGWHQNGACGASPGAADAGTD